MPTLIPYETLLDAARLHFAHVSSSANFTREARHQALALERAVTSELSQANAGNPARSLCAVWPKPEMLRLAS